jgi:hypothetical protein
MVLLQSHAHSCDVLIHLRQSPPTGFAYQEMFLGRSEVRLVKLIHGDQFQRVSVQVLNWLEVHHGEILQQPRLSLALVQRRRSRLLTMNYIWSSD